MCIYIYSIRHSFYLFLASIQAFILAFDLASSVSDILSGILSSIYSDILSSVCSGPGVAHCIRSSRYGSGPMVPTIHSHDKLAEEKRRGEEEGGEGEEGGMSCTFVTVESRDPHLEGNHPARLCFCCLSFFKRSACRYPWNLRRSHQKTIIASRCLSIKHIWIHMASCVLLNPGLSENRAPTNAMDYQQFLKLEKLGDNTRYTSWGTTGQKNHLWDPLSGVM